MPYEWTCPFCGRDTTVTDYDTQLDSREMQIDNAFGPQLLTWMFVVCPNPKCKRFTFDLTLQSFESYEETVNFQRVRKRNLGEKHVDARLVPPSSAKAFPEYVPQSIRADYEEACAIKDLSPKASATLARRCLQGMIRDFWKISKGRLVDEIKELQGQVDSEIWAAIDAVRKVGNIGAHMEADINVIVDVDDGEAGKLIWLIELLIKEWYIARHDRKQRVHEVIAVAQEKQSAKSEAKAVAKVEGK